MKIIRALSLAFAMLVPVTAMASTSVRAACPMGCCADHCPMSGPCPFC
ncbi:hypothetical protein BH11MYX3_BH11MYX3_10820 [soil metagenome]